MFELVIFDSDGVLVDSEPISNRILAERLSALGLPTTLEASMRDYMGRSLAACVEIIEGRLGRPLPDDFVRDFRERTFAAFRAELRPVAGIAEALDRIAAPTCVASSGDHEKLRTTLGVTGLLPRFEGRIFSATEVARGKPWPDLFLHAARCLGAAPGRCAVVEDTGHGVRAGRAAGMTVFGFAAGSSATELERAGARVFRSMAELPGLLAGGRA